MAIQSYRLEIGVASGVPAVTVLEAPSAIPRRGRSLAAVNQLLALVLGLLIVIDLGVYADFGFVVLVGPFCLLFWATSHALSSSVTPSRWWVRISCGACALHMLVFGIGFLSALTWSIPEAAFCAFVVLLFAFGAWRQVGGYPSASDVVVGTGVEKVLVLSGWLFLIPAIFYGVCFALSLLFLDTASCILWAGIMTAAFALPAWYLLRRG